MSLTITPTTGSHVLALQSTPPRRPTEVLSVSVDSLTEAQNSRDEQRSASLTEQTNFLPFKKVIVCFFGLALCILVSTLDSVIVATGIPNISVAFDAGSIASWIPSAYLLTSTSFQPLYGSLSDIFGRKAAISVAMLVFMLGNLIAGFSRTIKELIISRGIAGAGGGGMISMAQTIICDIVSLRDRGKYQGIIGIVIALGYTVGPLIGGSLAQNISWRWCFWICIPMSGWAMTAVIFLLPLKPVKGSGATILNNLLRSAMTSLGYSSALIFEIIDKPALLSSPATLGISSSDANFILDVGYTRGFRTAFFLNASLTALPTLISIILIKHKELNRGDENRAETCQCGLRKQGRDPKNNQE